MFTGIVEEIGRVVTLEVGAGIARLGIRAEATLGGTALGQSIAVEGVCLTVTEIEGGTFTFELAPETLRRTNLGDLEPGAGVNLERSLAADGRLGGHFVQGHIDGTGRLAATEPEGESLWMRVEAPPELLRYVVPKGYVAVDGVSLTVVDRRPGSDGAPGTFTFMLVPHTQQHVTLTGKPVGSRLNLEVDVLGKYVDHLLGETRYATRHG